MRAVARNLIGLAVIAACVLVSHPIQAQGDERDAAIQKKLKEEFSLTTTTADRTDIVKAGTVVTLQVNGLQMCGVQSLAPLPNNYKNGKISVSFGDKMVWGLVAVKPGTNLSDIPQRTFVAGEKFWITEFSSQKNGVFLHFYSDPYNDVRYYAQLKIPYPKGTHPPADDVLTMIAEVVVPDAPVEHASSPAAPVPPPVPAPIETRRDPVYAPIPPPPPPADAPLPAPPTVAVGQTKDQVLAILGPPQRVAKAATKEIDYYPDMKVIFTNGKVTDIR
jgi:hypothetical protein